MAMYLTTILEDDLSRLILDELNYSLMWPELSVNSGTPQIVGYFQDEITQMLGHL